jgi:hypothetical protein
MHPSVGFRPGQAHVGGASRPAFVPRTTGRRQEMTGTAEASNQQVRKQIRPSPQVARSAPRTLSGWRHGFEPRWDYQVICTTEYYNEPFVDDRVRLDPLDPSTSRHAGECEFAAETDPAVLKILLKVKDGAGGANGGWCAAAAHAAGWLRTTPRASGDDTSTTTDSLLEPISTVSSPRPDHRALGESNLLKPKVVRDGVAV